MINADATVRTIVAEAYQPYSDWESTFSGPGYYGTPCLGAVVVLRRGDDERIVEVCGKPYMPCVETPQGVYSLSDGATGFPGCGWGGECRLSEADLHQMWSAVEPSQSAKRRVENGRKDGNGMKVCVTYA